jgi:hypothetical protein
MADTPKMYRVYSIIPRKGQDDFWLNLGVAFPHEDGQGFNVLLQALPLPTGNGECKIVLRKYDPEAGEEPEDAKKGSAKRR